MEAYRAAGVNYDVLDEAKRKALAVALSTSNLLGLQGGRSFDASRGEPAFVFRVGEETLALVVECLGTKSSLCRAYADLTGHDHFDAIGYDTVAAIVNDLACVGASPLVVNAYFALGAPEWISTGSRLSSLVDGFARGCVDSGAVWGGGETPSLKGIIAETEIDLAGAAVGRMPRGVEPVLGEQLAAGDQIILLASTGIHTNGISLARQAAAALDDGLLSQLPSGRTFGEALLDESAIYVKAVSEVLAAGLAPSYLTHITGHGFRKLMRPSRSFTYRLSALPPVPESLAFLAKQSGLDNRTAYGTLNMGAGFAIYCREDDVDGVVTITGALGMSPLVAGTVEEGPRRVVIDPLHITYGEDELQLR